MTLSYQRSHVLRPLPHVFLKKANPTQVKLSVSHCIKHEIEYVVRLYEYQEHHISTSCAVRSQYPQDPCMVYLPTFCHQPVTCR